MDVSGFGEGQSYVGSTTVHTDSSGNANFGLTVPANLGGLSLSATAIAAGGDTSEFAKSVLVGTAPSPPSPIGTTTTVNVSPNPSTADQAITITATVSASDGSSPTGNVTFFIDGQSQAPAVALAVVGGHDVATFMTNPTAPGTHFISAEYNGSTDYWANISNTFDQVVQPLPVVTPAADAPTVNSVSWSANHAQPTTILISVSEALDAASAQNLANYTIMTSGRHGQFGKGSQTIKVTNAVYDAASPTVTLYPARRLTVNQRYELIVSGEAPAGVASTNTIMLDGADNGKPGSDYVGILDKTNLIGDPPRPAEAKPAAAARLARGGVERRR
jgi:hypothetical protein